MPFCSGLGTSNPLRAARLARCLQHGGRRGDDPCTVAKPRMTRPSPWPIAAVWALAAFAAVLWAIGLPGRGPSGSPSAEAPLAAGPSRAAPEPSLSEPGKTARDASAAAATAAGPLEIVLPTSGPATLDTARLAAGARVHSPVGDRATVLIGGAPLLVSDEDIWFEGIDFVWQAGLPPAARNEIRRCCGRSGRFRFRLHVPSSFRTIPRASGPSLGIPSRAGDT